jgi:hypothetical protein
VKEMDRTYSTDEMRNAYRILVGKPERDCLGNLDIGR